MDQKTGQKLIRAAMRQRLAPGKYDLFAWDEQQEVRTLVVPWRSFTARTIGLDSVPCPDCETRPTNAAPLPNGIGRHAACYVGSFRVDRSAERD